MFRSMSLVPRRLSSVSPLSSTGSSLFSAPFRSLGSGTGPLEELERTFVDPAFVYNFLGEHGVSFYAGVPDSLLKDFCAYVSDHAAPSKHVITANEGSAVAMAAGYHMATGEMPLVYLQNSGLGNTVNPLLSLADAGVYSIPMLLMIGWRGEPGRKDEPQHQIQGKLTPGLLTSLNIPYEVLADYDEGAEDVLRAAIKTARVRSSPYALLVRKRTFMDYKLEKAAAAPHELSREQAVEAVLANMGKWDPVVATTGFTSREVFEIRVKHGEPSERDFLTVGSMGHASAIAMGVAIGKPSRNVFLLDGDGAMLMHMGNAASVGINQVGNIRHIVLNNGAHDSVGAQTSGGFDVDFCGLAKACGYKHATRVSTPDEIAAAVMAANGQDGPSMIEVMCNPGARKDLGRPTQSPRQSKLEFMEFLRQ